MRVAVVAEWYPSPADPVHGIWAHRQALAARAAGAEVRVLVLRRPVPPLSLARRLAGGDPAALGALRAWGRGVRRELTPWELDGLAVTPVAWFGPPRPLSYGAWGWWMARPLARALSALRSRWRFDLVHAHTLAPTGWAAARWCTRSGVPLVLSAHGPDMTDVPSRSALGRRSVSAALGAADLVLANSRWARERCIELGGSPERIQTLHLGADLTGSAPEAGVGGGAAGAAGPAGAAGASGVVGASGLAGAADPARALGGSSAVEPLRLITVAHLQARKHHATVLGALARIDAARRPSYVIVGDGEERAGLELLAAELGVADRVTFCGQLPHPQALARLSRSDLFVMPGTEEPFGVAFVEAMAAGVPAIGSRGEGGPEDIVAAGPGMVLVAAGDVAELAGVLAGFDADRRGLATLGAAARTTVAGNFTWQRCGERTLMAYERVLAARDGGAGGGLA